jgi:hypothetical protein
MTCSASFMFQYKCCYAEKWLAEAALLLTGVTAQRVYEYELCWDVGLGGLGSKCRCDAGVANGTRSQKTQE